MRHVRVVVPLLALLGVAALLRGGGWSFGLPLSSNCYVRPDESLVVVAAVRMLQDHGDPHLTVYPAFLMTLCVGAYQLYYALAVPLGLTTVSPVPLDFGRDPSPYFLIARAFSALFGTMSVLLVLLLGLRLRAPTAAWVAAALFAVAPLAVRDSHFGVTDTATACLTTAALLALMTPPRRQGLLLPQPLLTAAVLLGLAIACKYSALVLLPVLALACLADSPSPARLLGRLSLVGATVMVVFVACNPYVLVRPGDYWGAVRGSVGFIYGASAPDAGLRLAAAQLLHPLRYGPGGMLGLALALVGGVWCLRPQREARHRWLVLAALLALAPAFSLRDTIFFRYTLLALPILAVLAGLAVDRIAGLAPPRLRGGVLALLLMGAVTPTAVCSVQLVSLLKRTDTRTLAGNWIRQHSSPRVPIVLLGDPTGEPQLHETAASLARRCDFVRRLYGEGPAGTINQLYVLQRDARLALGDGGVELIRQPDPADLPRPSFLVVQTQYPDTARPPLPAPLQRALQQHGRRLTPLAGFIALQPGVRYDRDDPDAFYLPFGGLRHVSRPGPNLWVSAVTAGPAGSAR